MGVGGAAMSLKRLSEWYGDHRMEMGIVWMLIGGFLTFIAAVSPASDSTPGFVYGLVAAIGNWFYWFWLIGPLLFMAGIWYFTDTLKKRKEFEKYMEIESKAKFVQHIKKLEELSWYLKKEDRMRLAEKKKKLLR